MFWVRPTCSVITLDFLSLGSGIKFDTSLAAFSVRFGIVPDVLVRAPTPVPTIALSLPASVFSLPDLLPPRWLCVP